MKILTVYKEDDVVTRVANNNMSLYEIKHFVNKYYTHVDWLELDKGYEAYHGNDLVATIGEI